MNRMMARVLTRLYPRGWRKRYGAEFEEHLVDGEGGLRPGVNVVWSAMKERMVSTQFSDQGGKMEQAGYSFGGVMKQWSAFVPVAMSLAAMTLVLVRVALVGTGPEVVVNGRADEGAVAHIWQLLMAGQLPVLAFFAFQWLRRAPRQAMGVLAVQVGAVLAAMAPVFYFNL
ncbi:MAG: hypothetical protein ABR976_18255 [Terracidiphilus sp.]|jgi:hypothetical protein